MRSGVNELEAANDEDCGGQDGFDETALVTDVAVVEQCWGHQRPQKGDAVATMKDC